MLCKSMTWKGSLNGNADALSRLPDNHCATTVSVPLFNSADLRQSQMEDGTISEVLQTPQNSSSPPKANHWNKQPLRRYRQLGSQLQIVDGVLCCTYTPSPHTEEISVPVLPESLRADAIKLCHDIPPYYAITPLKCQGMIGIGAFSEDFV